MIQYSLKQLFSRNFKYLQKNFQRIIINSSNIKQKNYLTTIKRNPNLGHILDQNKSESFAKNLRNDTSLKGKRDISWFSIQNKDQWPGYDKSTNQIRALPLVNLKICKRKDILEYFQNSWLLTEVLFSGLNGEEAFYRPPYHHLRHPLIFYYAHTAVVFVNKLRVAGLIENPINKQFETEYFEVGVDEMSWDDISQVQKNWPSVQEVKKYRNIVYNIIVDMIQNSPLLDEEITMDSKTWALVMGIEHEKIHLETSSVLIRELPLNLIQVPDSWPSIAPRNYLAENHPPVEGKHYQKGKFINFQQSNVKLGKLRNIPTFGWDNEYGERTMLCPEFSAYNQKVSNGEFWNFVTDLGYFNQDLWSHNGRAWKNYNNAKWPTFWYTDGPQGMHKYKLRTVFEVIDMPWDWPVITNYYEGSAYCKWLQKKQKSVQKMRLPSELEHIQMRQNTPQQVNQNIQLDDVTKYSGQSIYKQKGINFQLAWGSESTVNNGKPNSKGIYDSMGNVWEWLEGYASALNGFESHPYYQDFSTPCFDGKHSQILGGSFISTGDEASYFSRFHFRSHFFQHAGFRVIQSDELVTTDMDAPPPYVGDQPWATFKSSKDLEKYASEQLGLHYSQLDQNYVDQKYIPNNILDFPKRIAKICKNLVNSVNSRVLDLGCSVGGSVFELSKDFQEVIGLDSDQILIEAANNIKNIGQISYKLQDEGGKLKEFHAKRDNNIDINKINFIQGDFEDLNQVLPTQQFDLVLISNALNKLDDPRKILQQLLGQSQLLKRGGHLIIASQFSKFFIPDLLSFLENDYDLLRIQTEPQIMREDFRQYKLTLQQVVILRRK